jgi:hypothetical protein
MTETPDTDGNPILEVAAMYQDTLQRVSAGLHRAWGQQQLPQRWGITGYSEPTLVFHLAERLYVEGWQLPEQSEPCYPNSRQRTDLVATFGETRLWIEAKWWFYDGEKLSAILASDEVKLRRVLGQYRAFALIFTMDGYGLPSDKCDARWDETGACKCMEDNLHTEGLADRWAVRACAHAKSPYFGVTSEGLRKPAAVQDGLFVACFIELLK